MNGKVQDVEAVKFIRGQIASHPGLEVLAQGNTIVSIYPSDFLWGYTYHSHCIPPFKPESVLILGYGKGQIADLIRKVYGSDVKITGVDLVRQDYKYVEYRILIGDAKDYVSDWAGSMIKTRFDYVVIDLFDGEDVPEFVFSAEFASDMRKIVKRLLCLNVLQSDFERLRQYHLYTFKFHRFVPLWGNNISYWSV